MCYPDARQSEASITTGPEEGQSLGFLLQGGRGAGASTAI